MAQDGKSPAFQFYPGDFLSDERVALMTMEERGFYVTMLCHAWLEGSIPASVEDLATLMRSHSDRLAIAMRGVLGRCWQPHPDDKSRLQNPRLERVRETQSEHKKRRSAAGKAGSDARWGKNADAMRSHSSSSSSSTSSSPSGNTPPTPQKPWVDLPRELDTPDVRSALDEWVAVRARKRASNKPKGKTRALNKLVALSGGSAKAAEAILIQSADAGWADLYALRGSDGRNGGKTSDLPAQARRTLLETMEGIVDG